MKKNSKKMAVATITGAVLLSAPITTNMIPVLSAQTVEAAAKTGWVKESGKWYFYKDGAKATGWQEWDGKRYYLNSDGTMKANEWMIDSDGSIYYFRSWGGAYQNCKATINGKSYTFGTDGKMQSSQWISKGGKWYLAKDGKIVTGWQEWQGSKYYLNSDGTMRSNEWRLDDSGKIRYLCSWGGAYKNRSAKINGRSYTFNSNADVTNTQWIAMNGTWKLAKDGRIATGWQTWENNLYYLNSDGSMKANEAFTDGGKLYFFRSWGGAYKNCWYTSNGKKYYLHDNSAAYQNEWLKTGGKWYYFQNDSTMATNTWIDNYYVDASGVWIQNKEKPTDKWITSGNRKWYRHADGSYTKNDWELINGKYYRFDNDGWMVTGWKKINGIWYYMDKTTGERYGEGWHKINSKWYYMNADGEMAADTWIDTYYVDASGAWTQDESKIRDGWIDMGNGHKRVYFKSGNYLKSEYISVDGVYYLFDENGYPLTGWQTFKGKRYYLNEDGTSQTEGWHWIDGKRYYMDSTGAVVTDSWIDDCYVDKDGVWCDHQYEEKISKEPTCVEAGEKIYTCKNCKYSYSEYLPPTGKHTYTEKITKEASCNQIGEKILTCSVCGETKTEEIASWGDHIYELKESVLTGTCIEPAHNTYVCKRCGDVWEEIIQGVPKEHSYVYTVISEATCLYAGSGQATCSLCGYSYKYSIPEKGHQYEEVVTEATCENLGVKQVVCSVCGYIQSTEYTPKLQHDYIHYEKLSHYVEHTIPYDETITEHHKICNQCGMDFTELADSAREEQTLIDNHYSNNAECLSYSTVDIEKTIHYTRTETEEIIDREEYYECSRCHFQIYPSHYPDRW